MYDSKNMVNDLTTKKAIAIPASVQTQRGGQYSVNIVCAKNNRKSIKLTKKLADKLATPRAPCSFFVMMDGTRRASPFINAKTVSRELLTRKSLTIDDPKALYGLTAYHVYEIRDDEASHIFEYVTLKSYASPPPLIFT